MDFNIKEYYRQSPDESPRGHFHKVIALHESRDVDWGFVKKNDPNFCKGWFELSRLDPRDRIEFCRDFWLAKLPYHPMLQEFIINFFKQLDEIGVFMVQQKFDDPFEGHLVYCLSGNRGFFKGLSPITDQELNELRSDFPDYIFPVDYLAFLQIHNGFCKTTDTTGITRSTAMKENYDNFQAMLAEQDALMTAEGVPVNPRSLIPFYESFGMPFFQCFYGEWYPEDEMGNVYYSTTMKTISIGKGKERSLDVMAFPTFTDWLLFYMEQIE